MSLRSRIGVAFLVLVALLLGVGLLAMRNNQRIGALARQLRLGDVLDVGDGSLAGAGVEISGDWDPATGFTADGILRLPEPRRPKLRGRIASLDTTAAVLRLYGVDIHVAKSTEFPDVAVPRLASLRPGMRVEVSARVDRNGRWEARKIVHVNVKDSDKIKGTVTWSGIDGEGTDSMAVHGIPVHFVADRGGRSGPLAQVARAAGMELAVSEMRAAANELLHPHPGTAVLRADPGSDETIAVAAPPGAEARLRRALATLTTQSGRYAKILAQSAPGTPAAAGIPDREVTAWADTLRARVVPLARHVEHFAAAAQTHPDAARELLDSELDPFLENAILPLVHALRGDAQENLEDEIRGIEAEAASSSRLFAASIFLAFGLALVLATTVWRSVATPVRALHRAAQEIAHARFETRVPVLGNDELGVLARAFNTMAEELAASTVTVANMKGVLDSMAAPLMLVDAHGRITQANRAASRLLGYEPEVFLGKTWSELQARDDAAVPAWDPDSLLAAGENQLRHRDGTLVPVSFAAAPLGDGTAGGFVCVALDRSTARHAEERLHRSLLEKDLLLREVHHRVKNNLQVISSLLDLQSSSLEDPAVLEQFEESQNRIRTMALIHEQLYRATGIDHVDVGAYLERLVSQVVRSATRAAPVRFEVHTVPLELDMDRAMTCGLVVNELVSNALKHAFAGRDDGEIRLQLALDGTDVVLQVEDNGRGLPDGFVPAATRSLGMTLVDLLVRQLEGEIHFEARGGTRVRIRFPATAKPALVHA